MIRDPAPEVERKEPTPVPTRRPILTVSPIPTNESEEVIALPDFEQILVFGGGGAGPVSC